MQIISKSKWAVVVLILLVAYVAIHYRSDLLSLVINQSSTTEELDLSTIAQLRATWATNAIYVLIFFVGAFAAYIALQQQRANKLQAVSYYLKQMNDSEILEIRSSIKRNIYQLRILSKKAHPDNDDFKRLVPNFDRLLNFYNDIGLQMENNLISPKNLPKMFHKNVILNWQIFENFINTRRSKEHETFEGFDIDKNIIGIKVYAEHFEFLKNKSKNYLMKR